jgi:hypothetical protein
VLCLPCLLDCLALERGGRRERRICLKLFELSMKERMLFRKILLEGLDVGKLVGEILRRGGVGDQGVSEGLWVWRWG